MLTAVTAQNTTSVLAIAEVPEEVIVHQIDGVLEDIGADAIKTGMLSAASIIEVVADRIEAWGITNLVVDPVMVAKSGDALLQPNAVRTLVKLLLPLALVVTPNIPEAEVLSGKRDQSIRRSDEEAARIIGGLGPRYVVIKGGHRDVRRCDRPGLRRQVVRAHFRAANRHRQHARHRLHLFSRDHRQSRARVRSHSRRSLAPRNT